jgi:hypothetical protein
MQHQQQQQAPPSPAAAAAVAAEAPPLPPPAAAAAAAADFTALTASTRLCALELGCSDGRKCIQNLILFRPGSIYPHLHEIDLTYMHGFPTTPALSEQQLCSCCPALQCLHFSLREGSSLTALRPLQQLTGLTTLGAYGVGPGAAAAAEAMGVSLQKLLIGWMRSGHPYMPEYRTGAGCYGQHWRARWAQKGSLLFWEVLC